MRSSSYNSYDWCEHRYYLEYVLGLKTKSNRKADLGNICHKALELLALKKLAIQQKKSVVCHEFFNNGEIPVEQLTIDKAVEHAFGYLTTNVLTHHDWGQADYNKCESMVKDVYDYNGGAFYPENLNIIAAEYPFDFTIDKPWAKYNYKLSNGIEISGNLSLKGTVDLVTSPEDDIIEIIDWKTGRRLNWATGEEKLANKFIDDPQLRMYHFAISKSFPKANEIYFTIFYITDGGPISVQFSKADLPKTEEMIRSRFEDIKSNTKPGLIYPHWKCTKLCGYYSTMSQDGKNNLCKYHKNEIVQLGINKATEKHANIDALVNYQDGGGRFQEK